MNLLGDKGRRRPFERIFSGAYQMIAGCCMAGRCFVVEPIRPFGIPSRAKIHRKEGVQYDAAFHSRA